MIKLLPPVTNFVTPAASLFALAFTCYHLLLTYFKEGLYDKERVSYKDFRLRLNQILQEIVWAKADISLSKVFRNPSAQQVVAGDFNRVCAWYDDDKI
jgi:hypothetical protein